MLIQSFIYIAIRNHQKIWIQHFSGYFYLKKPQELHGRCCWYRKISGDFDNIVSHCIDSSFLYSPARFLYCWNTSKTSPHYEIPISWWLGSITESPFGVVHEYNQKLPWPWCRWPHPTGRPQELWLRIGDFIGGLRLRQAPESHGMAMAVAFPGEILHWREGFPHSNMGMGQNHVALVNIKIGGKWMFIP